MNIDNLTLFTQMMQAQNVNCIVLEDDFSNLYKFDMALRGRLYTGYAYGSLQDFIVKNCRSSEILKIRDDFALTSYVIYLTDDSISGTSKNFYLTVGPVLEMLPTPEQIHQVMKRKALPEKLFKDMQTYYYNVTIPPDYKVFESTLLNIACHLFSCDFKLCVFPEYGDTSFESITDMSKLNENPSIAIKSIEERYELEEKMLDAITSGDQTAAVRYHSQFRNFKIPPRNENELLNQKNLSIVFNTLCRKAVQKGHVHPVYIDELSTRVAIQINHARSTKELTTLDNDMIHKYCLLVRNHSMKNYSQIIQRCITYIDFHYAEPLTLAFFSDMCHVTKSYLSGLFKKETGTNLTDYIHAVRIRHSLVLLNSTQMPIHLVAASCGYNDINYYIKLFKRENGVSPKQYRVQMHQN